MKTKSVPKSCEILFVEITFQFKITTPFKYTSANNIVCLQLLKHASSNLYLRVPTGFTNWRISDTIDEKKAKIKSCSSGGMSVRCCQWQKWSDELAVC